MSAYYKYTSGEAFTLNGDDYIGYFHINDDGVAYTGRYTTSESEELSSKKTFMNSIHNRKLNLGATYDSIINVEGSNLYYFDLINKSDFGRFIDRIDLNNDYCFKSLILENPKIIDFQKYGGYYYSLFNEDADTLEPRNDTVVSISFANSSKYKFLDDITTGIIIVNSQETFKYFCSDGEYIYILEGSFDGVTPLTLIKTHPPQDNNKVRSIYHDKASKRVFIVRNRGIYIYDASNYDDCDDLILEDIIKFNDIEIYYIWNLIDVDFDKFDIPFDVGEDVDNPNNPEFIKFGGDYRTGYVLNGKILYVFNKYRNEVVFTVSMGERDIGELVRMDIRDSDEFITLLNKKRVDSNSDDYEYYITFVDPKSPEMEYDNTKLEGLTLSAYMQDVEFAYHDSNIFITKNAKEYQYRYIDAPKYVVGNIRNNNLNFPENFKWNTTYQFYKFMHLNWGYHISPENLYENINYAADMTNGRMYLLVHNKGRLYIMKQDMEDRFLAGVDVDLPKFYREFICSTTSAGLNINIILSNILKDTLNIYNKAYNSFAIDENQVNQISLGPVEFNNNDLIINGNETLNSVAFQRIVETITDIQGVLVPEKL